MVILHVAYTKNRPFLGVDVVVPKHVIYQQKSETVGFINVAGDKVDGVENQFDFSQPFDINNLPEPFNKPDLVVFHEVYRLPFIKIAKNLRKNKLPYVVVPHGSLTRTAQKKHWLKKFIGNLLLFSKFIKKAVAVQCLSEKEKEQSRIAKRKFVGTNGVDMQTEFKNQFNADNTDMVFIGRYDAYHKGLDLLFDAVKSIEDFIKEYSVKISLYGPDNNYRYTDTKELMKEKGVDGLISINPALSGEDKKRRLLSADVFIQTSRFEGMPVGIIEAMAYGVPCLITYGTNLGGILERYNAGWVAKTEVSDIADKIKKAVLDKESYSEKSLLSRKLVEENFTWEKVTKDTLDNYRQIIGG